MRIGPNQLRTLIMLGSPTMSLVVPGPEHRSLVKNGLLKTRHDYSFATITPTGLRALADEMEKGRVESALKLMKRDAEAARKRAVGRRR